MYGIEDVAISLPSIVNSEGVQEVLQFNLTPEEQFVIVKLKASHPVIEIVQQAIL